MSTMKEMKTQASWEASVTGLCNHKLNYISLPYECSGGTLIWLEVHLGDC